MTRTLKKVSTTIQLEEESKAIPSRGIVNSYTTEHLSHPYNLCGLKKRANTVVKLSKKPSLASDDDDDDDEPVVADAHSRYTVA